MEIIEANKLIEEYLSWLKENISSKNISENIFSIDTPFLDTHNDYIRLYFKYNSQTKNYIITDDGFTVWDIKRSGVKLEGSREKIFKMFINGLGINYNEKTEELFVESTQSILPLKKHKLIQAILNVGDMFILSEPHIKSLFFEDVKAYFDSHNIAVTSVVDITGKSYPNRIDFVIPSLKERKEKLIRILNKPSLDQYKLILFAFSDITLGNNEHSNSEQILIINDTLKQVSDEDIERIEKYNIKPVLWSKREEEIKIFE